MWLPAAAQSCLANKKHCKNGPDMLTFQLTLRTLGGGGGAVGIFFCYKRLILGGQLKNTLYVGR